MNPIGELEKLLLRLGEGTGKLKNKTLGGLGRDAYEGIKKTGIAMKDHPRAAIGGAVGGAAGLAGLKALLSGDGDEDDMDRDEMMRYIRGG